jgi:hypothetical protein
VRRGDDVQPDQLGDQRLVLVDALERALADLGLVRRVAGRELGSPDHLHHDRRHQMPVCTSTEEADGREPIPAGEARQLGPDLLLDERGRELPAARADRLRDVGEELIDLADADRRQHAPTVIGGVRDVAHRSVRGRIGRFRPSVRRTRPSP